VLLFVVATIYAGINSILILIELWTAYLVQLRALTHFQLTMKFQAIAIYCTLFTAFAADMVHANLITAWGKEKLVSSSTGGTFVSKVLRTAFSRHLQLDTNQVYHYTLVGDDLEGDDESKFFGSAVAVSGDGTRVAVGSQGDYGYTGSVIVFEYNPSTLQWAPFGTKIRGQSGGDYFGSSLAMSNDGSRLAVGAPNNYAYTGHVRVYQYNSVDDEWSLMGIDLDGDVRGGNAGTSVTISGDGSRVAMGAPHVSSSTGQSTAGRVLIFSYDGTNWVPSGDAIESQVRAFLGGAVALSENGNRLVVGGRTFTPPTNDGDPPLDYAGSVSVYDFVDNDWVQAGESLFGLEYYDRFGNDVDISDDGFRIVIGAFTSNGQDLNLRDIGQVSVFQEDTSIPAGWSQVGVSINGESESDKLGSSVSISGNGKVVVLGSPDNDDVKQNTGEVEVYQYVEADDIWKQVGIDIGGKCSKGSFKSIFEYMLNWISLNPFFVSFCQVNVKPMDLEEMSLLATTGHASSLDLRRVITMQERPVSLKLSSGQVMERMGLMISVLLLLLPVHLPLLLLLLHPQHQLHLHPQRKILLKAQYVLQRHLRILLHPRCR